MKRKLIDELKEGIEFLKQRDINPVIHSIDVAGEHYLSIWVEEGKIRLMKYNGDKFIIDEKALPDLIDILIKLQNE
jgi:hypothetical protein